MSEINVGLVGCGLISEAHLKAWAKTDGFTVRGVLDVNREQAEKRAKEYGVGTVFGGLDELVAACDVVDVCTPPQTHAAIAEKAIAARRHLVMEKPVVTDIADWLRMSSSIEAQGVKIAVIHNAKFLHSIQTAKKWVEQGRIGQIIRLQREFLTSATTDRMLVGDKHWSHRLPGGRWFETMPHELYLTHWFAGPLEVANVTALCTDRAPAGAPADEVVITMRGPRTLGTIHFSANCEQNRRFLTLTGTEGQIVVDLLSDLATISTKKDAKWRRAVGGSLIDAGQTLLRGAGDRARYGFQRMRGESPHARIISALARSLKGEGEEPTPLAEVDYVVRNCDLIGREIDKQVAAQRARR
jgi:predicted dehydrogenase